MSFKLTIVDDEGRNTVVPLPTGRDEFTIGRKDGNTIKLTEQNVSRQHARLVRANGSFYIEDKGSYTGVKVNGDRITGRRHIKEGDEIRIGDYHLSLAIEKQIEKEPKNGAAKGGITSGTAVIVLDKKQQERLRAGEKPSADRGRLCLLSGPLAGKVYGIERDEVVIGRTDDNDIVLNHRSISRNHAKIVVANNVHQIVDLGSANGVRVNGEEYGKIDLRKGDKIDLGHVRLRFVGPGEDFTYDVSMKEDVVGADDSGKGGAGLWAALAAVLVVVGVGGAYALGLFNGPEKTTLKPNPTPVSQVVKTSEPTKNPIPDPNPKATDSAALLKQAEAAAAKEDFETAANLAKQAGDDKMYELYFNEGNAKEFLPLCEERIALNNTDDIYIYCYEALKDVTSTNTYKKKQALIDSAKAKYKERAIADVKSSLDKAEAVVKANNAGQLGSAKAQVNSASEKISSLTKFLGEDGDVSALKSRAAALSDKLKDIKPVCDENACTAKNGKCDANTGTCKVEKIKCDTSVCPDGCKADNKTCKEPKVVIGPEPTKCDPAKCQGTCKPDGSCEASGTPPVNNDELADEIKSKLAQPDGCTTVGKDIEKLRPIAPADYWYFKGYCASDANPEKACDYYVKFLKTAKSDPRAARAKGYISGQSSADYPTCVLP